ncbi:MAG: hypothetical protein WCO33_01250 [bacterium]
MDNFEIKPKVFNPAIIAVCIGTVSILLIILMVILGVSDISKFISSQPYVLFVVFMVILIFFFIIVDAFSRKILVENNVATFLHKSNSGLGKWETELTIDFSKVIEVTDRSKNSVLFTGKTAVASKVFWLIFTMNDGTKKEKFVNAANTGDLKKLLIHFKSKYPNIKLNNVLVKDN